MKHRGLQLTDFEYRALTIIRHYQTSIHWTTLAAELWPEKGYRKKTMTLPTFKLIRRLQGFDLIDYSHVSGRFVITQHGRNVLHEREREGGGDA